MPKEQQKPSERLKDAVFGDYTIGGVVFNPEKDGWHKTLSVLDDLHERVSRLEEGKK